MIPSHEQKAVLASGLAPMRISAGAGTGKTTTVAILVGALVERHGLEPEEILGLTFTNKAAGELADRMRDVVAPVAGPGREAEVHTYHGFAAQLVREFGALVGIERRSSVITPTFSRQLLFDVVRHRSFQRFDATWPGSIEKVQRLGAALGDHLADPSVVAASAGSEDPWPERLDLLAAWDDYRAEKARLGVVDYADLIGSAARLLEENREVRERIRDRYRVVLLDEYQDTNPAQRIMLQRVFGDGFPVVAVGDTDQTIYEWRGATPDNFASFPIHFPTATGSPAGEHRLTVNRRSDEQVLMVANEVRRQIRADADALVAGPDAGPGEVAVRWLSDAVREADWIADQAIRLHEQGIPWSEMAVLFRKNRHIALVHDALVEREVPVEVANLGGLLAVPEVADLHAWLRVLEAPEDGPALLRILMGPRFALGMGDIAHLSRWARRRHDGGDDEADLDHEGVIRHTMLEAIDNLEELGEAPGRMVRALTRFRTEYRLLLEVAQGSTLAELARTILDVTGTWRDVEAMGPAGRLTARLNLYRFLDLTEEWSPLEGRPSLPAFLDHLAAMEDNPADELDAARLSGEQAVALLTVHRAKGLEWDVVFLPALTKGTFPAHASVYENPYEKAQFLPHEWRKDEPPPIDATTPSDVARDVLREIHQHQEWRTAYVAVTRARHRLYLSGAHWYGVPTPTVRPSVPGELFELVAGLAFARDLGRDPEPPRPDVLRAADRLPAPDPVFAEGWAAAVRRAVADPQTVLETADVMDLSEEVAGRIDQYRSRLFDIEDLPAVSSPTPPATSVTGLVAYAACPRRHFWLEVDRLPRRPSPAARRGVDVHRRIELHGLGHLPMIELDPDIYDLPESDGDGLDDDAPSDSEDPYAAYLGSRYASTQPLMVEVPFSYATEAGLTIRGRIDAIYGDEGGWEIVDFKSGRRQNDPWLLVQLQAYAVAAQRVDFGFPPPSRLTVSFVYLGKGLEVVSYPVDQSWAGAAVDVVESMASAIVAGEFDAIASPACHRCEFSRFCPPGRAWLEENSR